MAHWEKGWPYKPRLLEKLSQDSNLKEPRAGVWLGHRAAIEVEPPQRTRKGSRARHRATSGAVLPGALGVQALSQCILKAGLSTPVSLQGRITVPMGPEGGNSAPMCLECV